MGINIGALVVSYLKKYLGLLINNSSNYVCSAYLTLKLEYNMVSAYNLSFFGGAFALLMTFLIIVQLMYLLVKYCKC